MEKVKKVSKYILNGLNMMNALLIVLAPIWNWNVDNVTKTIVGVTGVLSTYLIGGKLFADNEKKDVE